jgi:predicted 3-demethylubiquinone-9 3-methyltransferase (glyoxalase superfamily)
MHDGRWQPLANIGGPGGPLSRGGQSGRCGRLKDKYGLSWQIIPTALPEFVGGMIVWQLSTFRPEDPEA